MSQELTPLPKHLPLDFEFRVASGVASFLDGPQLRDRREDWIATRDELIRRGYILFEYRNVDLRMDCARFKHVSICTTAEIKFRNTNPELYRPLILQ